MSKEIIREATSVLKLYVSRFKSVQKAAILLNSVAPETSLEVSRYLTEKDNKSLLPELHKMPYTNSIETLAVIDEFLEEENLWAVVGVSLKQPEEILPALEKWAQKNPRKLARMIKELWLSQK
jgi:flagellar motor switch protein FliG